jgi:hypothetical protein
MRRPATHSACRKSATRSSLLGMAMLIAVVVVSIAASGCGGTASASQARLQSQAPPATAARSSQTTAIDPLANERIKHDRVMAEQGRGSGTAATNNRMTPTTAASELESIPSASADPLVQGNSSTSVVLAGGQTPLKGVWSGTADRLSSFLLKANPSPRFTVPAAVLAEYYVRYCAAAGLRADLLWAQMIHETGYGVFGGDVSPGQNSYAGIGATGGGAPGFRFTSAEAGVMAQVAHMVAYVYESSTASWANASVDPRFDLVNPRGVASTLADLDGRWAVPGIGYGERIEAIARAINSD